MRYTENREASGEILRLLIPLMADHPATFTPLTYAVWYEHTAGINPALSHAIEDDLTAGNKIDDAAIERLYIGHIAGHNMDMQWAMQNDFRKMLNHLTGFTEKTGRQVNHFENSLQAHSDSLNQNLDTLQIDTLISSMARDATRMSGSIQNLQAELQSSQQQVEKLHQELESARKETFIDPLTGILNRRGFEAKAKNIFSDKASPSNELCLLIVDIDHFKKVNDHYGHVFGDHVLRATAKTLKSKIKGQDSVARWGGEEFAVLLPGTTVSGARAVAEHIRQSIEKSRIRRIGTNEEVGGITISIGIAAYTRGISFANLLDQADKALYVSKRTGRNRTSVHGQN
jgi:diguanylate cyclase